MIIPYIVMVGMTIVYTNWKKKCILYLLQKLLHLPNIQLSGQLLTT